MNRALKLYMYHAAFMSVLVGVTVTYLAWMPPHANEYILDRHDHAFALAAGVLTMFGMLLNKWDGMSFRNLARAFLILISCFWILIGLGGEGDGEYIWDLATLVWLVALVFAAMEMVRYTKR